MSLLTEQLPLREVRCRSYRPYVAEFHLANEPRKRTMELACLAKGNLILDITRDERTV